MRGVRDLAVVAGAAALLGIAACNRSQSDSAERGPSATADRPALPAGAAGDDRAGRYASASGGSRYGGDRGGYAREDRAPVPSFHGEPMWSENRSHTAQENAEYHFERAGNDLGAKTLDDFLTKVHRFCDQPPAGTQSLTRANGDRLLFDPKSNIFAVVTRDGAPRTVFKPSDGLAYWNEQKAREAQADTGGGSGSYGYRRRSYSRYGDSSDSDHGGGSDRRDRSGGGDEG